ncbi:MAG: hypothetical protein ABSF34_07770 [Verrucomicrobiota bacterium]
MKPLSVTLPFAARFTGGGGSQPCAGAHGRLGERKNRDSGGSWREPLARFLMSPPTSAWCRISEQQTGGVTASVKKATTDNHNIPSGFHGRPNGHPYCLNAADLLGMTTGDAGDWRMGAWAAFGKKTCQIRRTDVKRPESK